VIFIVVKFPVRPEHADDWPSLIGEYTAATRAEPGNISFDWFRSADDPTCWLLVEAFRDGAGQAHVDSAHFKAAMTQLPPLLAATPRIVNVEVPGEEWAHMAELHVEGPS
jgi:quinol monooxygenase YgiN